MTVEAYFEQTLKKQGIITNKVNDLKTWQMVTIGFINNENNEDATQFDIKNIQTPAGRKELAKLYHEFCKENNFPTDTVLYIEVNASADTHEELEAMTP